MTMTTSRSTIILDAWSAVPSPAYVGFLTVLVVATGCPASPTDGQSSDTPMASLDSQCVSDGECPDEKRCIAGLCSIEIDSDTLRYGLDITPSNSSPVPPQGLDVENRPLLDAEARVLMAERVSGQLATTDGDSAPAGTLVVEPVDSDASPSQQIVRDGEFTIHQRPGRYALSYIVDDDRWPRIPLGEYDITSADDGLELEMPHFGELRTVSGHLERTALELLDILAEPVEDAKVVAHSRNSDRQSQFATTDEDGEFVLHLPPGSDEFDIMVRPTSDNPIVPRATFPREIDGDTNSVSLSLGELDLELATLALDVDTSSRPEQEPDWRDMRVEVQRPVDAGELRLTPPIEDGQIDTNLPLGDYEIEIIPPADSPWSPVSRQISLVDSIFSDAIELPARPRVVGKITGPDDRELGGVRIDIEPLDDAIAASKPIRTNDDGSFETWLSPGEYRMVARPPTDQGLPTILQHIDVDHDGAEVDVQLPHGVIATGRLTTEAGDGIGYAAITAINDDDLPIARSHTDSSGLYRLVLPPSILEDSSQ